MAERCAQRKRAILLFGLAGALIALLAGLSQQLEWLASLCTGLGDGCKATAQFSLFGVPVWLWGVLFYLLVIAFWVGAYGMLFWLFAAGFGADLGLMWLMLSTKTTCVFCIANFLVMCCLIGFSFQKERFWQSSSFILLFFLLSLQLFPNSSSGQPRALTDQGSGVVARAAGQIITYDELIQPVASRINDLQQQIYRLERERLDQLIAKIVLEKEAENRGKPLQELVRDFLGSQDVAVGSKEIEDYYTENRARFADWSGSQQDLMAQIGAYLQQLKRQQLVLDYSRSLGPKHDVAVYLKEPRLPLIQVNIEKDDPVFGPRNAPLTIFEFSDYQCPACRKSHALVREMRRRYGDRIRWVFKDFPMPGHKWARGAAMAAHCAAEQGKFWEYQDLLFSARDDLTPEHLLKLAKDLGLQHEPFVSCLEDGRYQPLVDKYIEEARKFGLDTTPSFVINNRLVSGAPPPDRFIKIIDEELQRVPTDG